MSSDVTDLRDPASVAAGEALYEASCARCHGADLDGGRTPSGASAPSLAALTAKSDAALIETVKRGRGLGMPSFQTQLEEAEIVSIVDFVRSVQADRTDG